MHRSILTLPLLLGIVAVLIPVPIAVGMWQATPAPGTDVLYLANEQDGFEDWSGSPDWILRDGHLLNTGTAESNMIPAPYELPAGASDYAVEVELRLIRCDDPGLGGGTPNTRGGFGIVVRAEEVGAYWVGFDCSKITEGGAGIWAVTSDEFDELAAVDQQEPVDAEWHRYRVEVEGFEIRLFVDDNLVIETMDLRLVSPGQVGLWSSHAQVEVRGFTVVPLDGGPNTGTPSAKPTT